MPLAILIAECKVVSGPSPEWVLRTGAVPIFDMGHGDRIGGVEILDGEEISQQRSGAIRVRVDLPDWEVLSLRNCHEFELRGAPRSIRADAVYARCRVTTIEAIIPDEQRRAT